LVWVFGEADARYVEWMSRCKFKSLER